MSVSRRSLLPIAGASVVVASEWSVAFPKASDSSEEVILTEKNLPDGVMMLVMRDQDGKPQACVVNVHQSDKKEFLETRILAAVEMMHNWCTGSTFKFFPRV